MKISMQLLTWLDIRRKVWEELSKNGTGRYPKGIIQIDFSWSGIDIYIEEGFEEVVEKWLRDIFSNWFDRAERVIRLLNNERIPVEIQLATEVNTSKSHGLPLWWDVSRYPDNKEETNSLLFELPEPWERPGPHLVAFYSFKGGVSRTTHLLSCLAALRNHKMTQSQNYKVLLIDADVEAPGFSFWDKQVDRISYVDFLEMLHLRPLDEAPETIRYVANELEKSKTQLGKVSWYVLPAFRNEAQLLHWPIKPEHLVRGLNNQWILADRIYQLGKHMDAQLVLIDLRAGLSEMSSPLMLDPRVDRFLITTLNQQSLRGTELVLRQIAKTAPSQQKVQKQNYTDPVIIFSMVQDDAMDKEDHLQAKVDFANLYPESTEDLGASSRLECISTKFAQELLSIKGWDDFYSKISGTHLQKEMFEVVERWLPYEMPDTTLSQNKAKDLGKLCEDLVHAERSQSKGLLFTQSLRNMALNFKDNLPNLTVLGSKGAGKTYTFLELVTMSNWSNFCKGASVPQDEVENTIFFPFLESENLDIDAKAKAREARKTYLGGQATGDESVWRNRILHASQKEKAWTEVDWEQFWVKELVGALELECLMLTPLGLHEAVKRKNAPVIVLVDGLEDLLKDVSKDETQLRALRVLLQLPRKLSEIRDVQIGMIIFVRRDLARAAIIQNFGQFSANYAKYELRWEFKEMLQLIAWLCIKVGIIDLSIDEVFSMGYAELDKLLYPLWGTRMGAPNSREARTSVWVYCALADYNKNLQARDLVRLLFYATKNNESKDATRLLSPSMIKKALPECSKMKVEEALIEFPQLKLIKEKLETSRAEKRVPFSPTDFQLSGTDISFLESNGIIAEVKGEYHIPEIYRFGLKFELTKNARPRVVAFGKELLGPILKEFQS